ncbi:MULTISPECIES: excinuclease ABC subunit UvrC [Corynebacterium]|uniref:excinuclease ABC subunit UvrC n=1 Tax=Corynebacterium TaxID=1716 RepID=UPI0007EADAE0|nr:MULTISPECIES: excinuclease ABC subunit UvrC [Corynebacterium]MCT1634551.1 excinuclease ABC subunit UvrC [Corynebacterium pseudodiphtheriticum]MCT1665646.1 excinuclease ABC subunit UvrC [Corynebacterium pseudodiphtheriticum]MDC7110150.1 excinuclease ABC subunit UvrC [Corynebacterium pseudodiphtheriticum]MDC7113835.1 excinuclease ABC subunit UvrC [Corynebacterium pseudodiphtheriticum]MDK4243193.1 excinuclease ABC subunit UvrC [Corynebacterium pseudodiphtheriticum]
MSDPATYRPAPGTIPTEPGVYKFRDENRRVVYVGKAKNLRARLSNYFQDITQLHPRTRQMVQTADSVEWTVVASEVEALQLEYTWIKRFDPRFNVMYRDDKTYPMLAVSVGEQVPRVFFYRGPRKRGVRYFGPYAHAWAVRETMDLLLRVFPMRSCSSGVYRRHERLGRPCLLGYIGKCDAPCIGRVSADEHRETVNGLVGFMRGRTNDVVKRLTADMEKASEELEFEKAARLRDDLGAIDKLMEQQTVVLGDGTAADLIAFADDELEAAVQIFHVRDGRIRGQRGWVVEKLTELPELIENFLVQFYSDAAEREEMEAAEDAKLIDRRGVDQESRLEIQEHDEAARTTTRDVIPRQIMVHTEPQDVKQVSTVLSDLRGGSVEVRVPQRGEKKALMDTVYRNALDALKQHKLKRVGDLTARSAALQDLQTSLFLDSAPLRIECIDISHIQGTDVVASLVVFEDGLPRKASYRRYRIKEAAGGGHSDDVASIAEVTRRRFKRHQDDKLHVPDEELEASTFADEDVTEESADGNRFAYPPQLFVVDGGLPQVNAAQKVFDDLGVNDVALIGLAKRLEEIWVPGEEEPIILPRGSEALYLLQHIRDEAHRFAISYHRQQRSKRMRSSALDAVPGLGPARRADLVKHFGSVKKLKQASVKEITEVKGFGPALAESIYAALHK